MRPFVYVGLLLGLSLFGFGCKQPDYQADQPTNWRGVIQGTPSAKPTPTPSASSVDTRPFFDNETPIALEVPLMRQALSNLASATSFRATLKLPPAEGQEMPIRGELSFSRSGGGFRGMIAITPQITSEVLAVGDEVLMRANTSTWQSITKTPDGKKLRLFFQIAFPAQARPNQILVSDSARILETKDDPSGCRAYTYTEVLPSGDLSKTVLCIKDGLPAYIINEYAEGNTEVYYRDVNQPVDIHQAMTPIKP